MSELVSIPARLEPANGLTPYFLELSNVAHFEKGLEFTFAIQNSNIGYEAEIKVRANKEDSIGATYKAAHESLVDAFRHLLWQADVIAESYRKP